MRFVRWAAVAATVLMSLMNVPVAFDPGGSDLPVAVLWVVTLLGVVGLVAAAGLARRTAWGLPAVLVVGVINLVGAVLALTDGQDGAAVGLTVSALMVALAALTLREPSPGRTVTA